MGKMGKVRGWKKSLAAFLLLASLLGLLAGCQPKPEDILKRAIDKTNGAESYRSVMTGQIGVGSQGISATVEFTLDLEAILTPMKAKGKVKIDMGGFAEEMEVYIDEDYTRLGMGGYWLRAPREEENVKSLDLTEWMTSYTESVKEVFLLKEEELEGRTCYKLEALLDGQKLMEIGQKNLNATDGPEDMPQMAELDDLTVYFWVDKKSSYIAGLEADLAPMTQKLLADSPFEGEMTVTRYTINLRNTDFDAVEDFQIPPEALEAEDMENPFPLLPF